MWNLIQPPNTNSVYRPSSISGVITNGANAFDVDSYPWATATDIVTWTGSNSVNISDANVVIYSGFPSIAKTAFSFLQLGIVFDYGLFVPFAGRDAIGHPSTPAYYVSANMVIDYSINGGTSWTNTVNLYPTMTANDLSPVFISASNWYKDLYGGNFDISLSNATFKNYITNTTVQIPAANLTSNLNDAKVRVRVITETNNIGPLGTKISSASYRIWDIQAVVS